MSVLSAAFNVKGNIVCTFASKPAQPAGTSVDSTLDSHAQALGTHLTQHCAIGIPPADQPIVLTPSRVRPRSTLRISMVPTRDPHVEGGAAYSEATLLEEIRSNPALKNLEFTNPPHFACRPDRLADPKLEYCPVTAASCLIQ